MIEPTGELVGPPNPPEISPRERLNQTLADSVPNLNQRLATAGLPPIFRADQIGAIQTHEAFEKGFRFWGSLEQGFMEFYSGPVAIIKDIKVPEGGMGVGSILVRAWEDETKESGIDVFVATNIKDEKALGFWRKKGYLRDIGAYKNGIPYAVAKEK